MVVEEMWESVSQLDSKPEREMVVYQDFL